MSIEMSGAEGPKIDYARLKSTRDGMESQDFLDEQKKLLTEIKQQVEAQKSGLRHKDTAHETFLGIVDKLLGDSELTDEDEQFFHAVLQASIPHEDPEIKAFAEGLIRSFKDIQDVYIAETADLVETVQREEDLLEYEIELSEITGLSNEQTVSLKKYFMQELGKETRQVRTTLRSLLRNIKRVNAPSMFAVLLNSDMLPDRTQEGSYVPTGKRLSRREKKALETFSTEWFAVKDQSTHPVKQGIQLLAAVFGNNEFRETGKNKLGGRFAQYIDRVKTYREDAKSSNTGVGVLTHLIGDTDLDGSIESLDQSTTSTKRSRKRLEKTQKEQGRGVISEDSFAEQFTNAIRVLKSQGEVNPENTLAVHLSQFLATQPQFAYLQETLTDETMDMVDFVDLLLVHPELIGALRTYARLVPYDFSVLLRGGVGYVNERAKTQQESTEQYLVDKEHIDQWLATPEGMRDTQELLDGLDQKFRGILLIMEGQKHAITQQIAAGNAGLVDMDEATRAELVHKYTALQQGEKTLQHPETAKRMLADLIHIGGLVSVIPGAEGGGGAATLRLYDAGAKHLLQHIDIQVGGFQGVGDAASTAIGINLVLGGTLAQSKRNTLFYALYAGSGAQLVQGVRGFGRHTGMVLGNEFWLNPKKIKKLTPTNKLMVGALVGGGLGGSFSSTAPLYKPWSGQAGMYLRRDKLAGLEQQQGEIYVTVLELLKKITDPSPEKIREVVTAYCKEKNIKQTPEEFDRVARVLSSALMPYQDQLGGSFDQQPDWMVAVAEQIALNRFNAGIEDLSGFVVSGVGLGVGINFLGIYPAVGVQTRVRKSSVYLPDKDSELRAGTQIEGVGYDEKLDGSFFDTVPLLNMRFGFPEQPGGAALQQYSRDVEELGRYPFVTIDQALLSESLQVLIAPDLIQENTYVFRKTPSGDLEIPGTLPVRVVQHIVNGRTEHLLVIGDTIGKDAQRYDAQKVCAENDQRLISYQAEVEKYNIEAKRARIQEQLFAFLITQPGFSGLFDLARKEHIDVQIADDEITGYRFKLRQGVHFDKELPETLDQEQGYLVLPADIQLNAVYSAIDQTWLLTTEVHENGLSFGYEGIERSFSSLLTNEFNIDLLNVHPSLRSFLSSTAGTEMLMAWRYGNNGEKQKDAYYKLLREALVTDDYTQAYDLARSYINTHGTDEVKKLFTAMQNNGVFDRTQRANLYLIYGALSRVRMTEYKHLADQQEKQRILDTQLKKITDKKMSSENKTYLRDIISGKQPFDITKVENILRSADGRFTGRGDKKYYYTQFPNRTDPIYRLIFLFAPVAKIYETRTAATQRRLTKEFGSDTASAQAVMRAYGVVQDELNRTPDKLFADTDAPNKIKDGVGLVFGYGPHEIDEKFVFYPQMTGAKVDLERSGLGSDEQQRIKTYFLKEYMSNNPYDVRSEVDALISGISNQFNQEGVEMSAAEKQQKIHALTNKLISNDTINEDVYISLMRTGTIQGLDRFNTDTTNSILQFSPEWGLAAFSECINFMITKGTPKITTTLKERFVAPQVTPAPVHLEKYVSIGDVVANSGVVLNQADRRESAYSFGVVGGVLQDPEYGESSTSPQLISEEDYDKIVFSQDPSTVEIDGVTYDGFAGSLAGVSGTFYEKQEGNIFVTYFLPDSGSGPVGVSEFLYGGRHQEILAQQMVYQLLGAKRQQLPYDAYKKQHIDFAKKTATKKSSKE